MTNQRHKNDQPQPFLPRYSVIDHLGEGGVGTVYKVRDNNDGSIRALKALKHGKQTQRNVERFEEEYRTLRRLHHPSLPEVFDYGITREETRYIVMEFVEGEPFDGYFARHPDDVWLLLFQLSEALAFIHDHKLLHLDLKPRNILVTTTKAYGGDQGPLVMLLDFGVSHHREKAGRAAIVGTPAYMAPEIILNEDAPTRAADYYSLGATLFELIEGKPPFHGTVEEVLQAHLSQEITFDTKTPELTDLYQQIRRLLNKDPKVRLEAFDDFRSAAAIKVGDRLATLEQTYGMGYLDSLGVFGKKDIWERIRSWARGVARQVRGRNAVDGVYDSSVFRGIVLSGTWQNEESSMPGLPEMPSAEGVPDIHLTTHDDPEVFKKTTVQLHRHVELRPDLRDVEIPIAVTGTTASAEDVPRCILLSGATGSGKSDIVDALKAELQISGIGVTVLGENGEYEAIVSGGDDERDRTGRRVSPQSLIIDRFVRGWEYLADRAADQGMVLIIDGYQRVSKEITEFVEYVSTRLEFVVDEGLDPGLFVVVTSRNPQLKSEIEGSLPPGHIEELVIPPPGREEVEEVLAQFHGHMPGHEDRNRLKQYLVRDSRSSGVLVDRLKEALLRGDLVWAGGKWGFPRVPTEATEADEISEDYYQMLLRGLEGTEKELIYWLSCNRGPLYQDEFVAMSGMKDTEFQDALERIRPRRVVEIEPTSRGISVGIVSRSVREAFYVAIPPNDRHLLHAKFINHVSGHTIDSQRMYRMAIYHYEQMGDTRTALLMRVRSIRMMMRAQEVFGVRESCGEGIDFIRKLDRRDRSHRMTPMERYFLKQWVNAEWLLDNFKGVAEVIKVYVIGRHREVPVSFCYKYATALEKIGEVKACRELITTVKKRIRNKASEPHILMSLVDASVLRVTGAYESSVRMLDRIRRHTDNIDPSILSQMNIFYMLNYENLGIKSKHEKYMKLAESTAKSSGNYGHLLTVSFSKVMSFFNASRYEKAKRTLRQSIRTAKRHRVYQKLSSAYFLASAVYYEEGNYKSALKFLDKANRIAINMGMQELVYDYMVRYALIYQNLGYYGSAIRIAEAAKNQMAQEYRSAQYFFALLILLDLHNSVKHERASALKLELDRVASTVEAKYRLALYHLLSGDYYFDRGKHDEAYEEFEIAYNMYEAIGYQDDVARCLIRMAHVLIEEGNYSAASVMLDKTRPKIKKMESEDLEAEYAMANLALHLRAGDNPRKLNRFLDLCERMWLRISDINIRLRMTALICRALIKKGADELALRFFNQLYDVMKQIAGNLPGPEYARQFMTHRDFTSLVREINGIKSEHPDQPVRG
jgi:serine/threonine-protein kinase